jgi:transposase
MVSTMKIVDTKASASAESFRVRTNRTGRRTYSREYKLEIVNECEVPGVSVAAIALSHGINANLVRRWIVEHRRGRLCPMPPAPRTMLPVTVAPTGTLAALPRAEVVQARSKRDGAAGVIEIELEAACIRVRGAVHCSLLRTVLTLLAKR